MQYFIDPDNYRTEIRHIFQKRKVRSILLVCGKTFFKLFISDFIKDLELSGEISVKYFMDFSVNPKYEDILKGVEALKEGHCNFILAVGGGSAIDVAKGVKFFATSQNSENNLWNKIPLFVIPTTAGSGSEATQFAVMYVNGGKRSIENNSIMPEYILLYPNNLRTLPSYQKKVTVCDALAHAIESYWSIYSSIESRSLSVKAINLILDNIDAYIRHDNRCYKDMLIASNLAGQAINLSKTTAAHAMSYQLTTMWGIPHGHAVILCLPEVWEFMQKKVDNCIDQKEYEQLGGILKSLAYCLRQDTSENAILYLKQLRSKLGLEFSKKVSEQQIDTLVCSVNIERLKNLPVVLDETDLREIYKNVLMEKE